MSEQTGLETAQVTPQVALLMARHAARLAKASQKHRELARELATSLPRGALTGKALFRKALMSADATEPQTAASLIRMFLESEAELARWRAANSALIERLSQNAKNMWAHIKVLEEVGKQFPTLSED